MELRAQDIHLCPSRCHFWLPRRDRARGGCRGVPNSLCSSVGGALGAPQSFPLSKPLPRQRGASMVPDGYQDSASLLLWAGGWVWWECGDLVFHSVGGTSGASAQPTSGQPSCSTAEGRRKRKSGRGVALPAVPTLGLPGTLGHPWGCPSSDLWLLSGCFLLFQDANRPVPEAARSSCNRQGFGV